MDQALLPKSVNPGDPVGPGDVVEIDLAIRRIKMREAIGFRPTVEWDPYIEAVVLRMVRSMAALPAKETLSVPATWWDHVKERFAPPWLLRRWPVRYEAYRAYVYLPNVAIPDDYRRASFLRWEKHETPHR